MVAHFIPSPRISDQSPVRQAFLNVSQDLLVQSTIGLMSGERNDSLISQSAFSLTLSKSTPSASRASLKAPSMKSLIFVNAVRRVFEAPVQSPLIRFVTISTSAVAVSTAFVRSVIMLSPLRLRKFHRPTRTGLRSSSQAVLIRFPIESKRFPNDSIRGSTFFLIFSQISVILALNSSLVFQSLMRTTAIRPNPTRKAVNALPVKMLKRFCRTVLARVKAPKAVTAIPTAVAIIMNLSLISSATSECSSHHL